jgi:hypothetical protein
MRWVLMVQEAPFRQLNLTTPRLSTPLLIIDRVIPRVGLFDKGAG